jgi:hypothetical protein
MDRVQHRSERMDRVQHRSERMDRVQKRALCTLTRILHALPQDVPFVNTQNLGVIVESRYRDREHRALSLHKRAVRKDTVADIVWTLMHSSDHRHHSISPLRRLRFIHPMQHCRSSEPIMPLMVRRNISYMVPLVRRRKPDRCDIVSHVCPNFNPAPTCMLSYRMYVQASTQPRQACYRIARMSKLLPTILLENDNRHAPQ